jgi:hypothetical protein
MNRSGHQVYRNFFVTTIIMLHSLFLLLKDRIKLVDGTMQFLATSGKCRRQDVSTNDSENVNDEVV